MKAKDLCLVCEYDVTVSMVFYEEMSFFPLFTAPQSEYTHVKMQTLLRGFLLTRAVRTTLHPTYTLHYITLA